ncbi:MAG: hypothetical protein LYZ66_06740 [Nitrososphaerales archaeon]|nr:hypothetical protein [Nitrososphaerales archaeon]
MFHVDSATGELEEGFLNTRVWVMTSDFYAGLRRRLFEVFKDGTGVMLYQMGAGYGELMGKRISEMGSSKLSVYRSFISVGNKQGYGRFDVPLLKTIISRTRGEAIIRLKNSFFGSSAGKTGQTECFLVAGMIAGAAEAIQKKTFSCVEEKCVSKGDEYCEFRLKESTSTQ